MGTGDTVQPLIPPRPRPSLSCRVAVTQGQNATGKELKHTHTDCCPALWGHRLLPKTYSLHISFSSVAGKLFSTHSVCVHIGVRWKCGKHSRFYTEVHKSVENSFTKLCSEVRKEALNVAEFLQHGLEVKGGNNKNCSRLYLMESEILPRVFF